MQASKSTLTDCCYVDTRIGNGSMYSPPETVNDYAAWFLARYQSSLGITTSLSFGVAQRVQAMLNQQQRCGIKIMAFGPHAGAFAEVLAEITGGKLDVEVLW